MTERTIFLGEACSLKFSHFFNFDALPERSTEELLDDITHLSLLADRLGFDALYVAEHHFTEYGVGFADGRADAPAKLLERAVECPASLSAPLNTSKCSRLRELSYNSQ